MSTIQLPSTITTISLIKVLNYKANKAPILADTYETYMEIHTQEEQCIDSVSPTAIAIIGSVHVYLK